MDRASSLAPCAIECGRMTSDSLCPQCRKSFDRLDFDRPIDLIVWAVKRTRYFAYRRRGVPAHSRRAKR